MIYFYLCNACRDFVSNDDLSGVMNDAHEAEITKGAALLQTGYFLSFYNSTPENSFKCECCGVRTIGDRNMYAGERRVESGS